MCDYKNILTGYEYYTTDEADVFFGVVVVDTSGNFDWQAFDWGHSLIPESQLSSQVIIGDGRRCAGEDQTRTNCDEYGINYVWITPVANAKIWVSLNGETNYTEYNAKRLSSLRLGDEDTDLSGAYIFATEPNAQSDGPPVDFAAVWGQEPYESSSGSTAQRVQLDMVSEEEKRANFRETPTLSTTILHPSECHLCYLCNHTYQPQGTWQKGVPILQVLKTCVLLDDLDDCDTAADATPGDRFDCTIKVRHDAAEITLLRLRRCHTRFSITAARTLHYTTSYVVLVIPFTLQSLQSTFPADHQYWTGDPQ